MALKASASSRISGGEAMFSGSPNSPRATVFVFSLSRVMGALTAWVLSAETTMTSMTARMSVTRITFAVFTEIASIRVSRSSRSAAASFESSRRFCAASGVMRSRSARKRAMSPDATPREPVGPAVSRKSRL